MSTLITVDPYPTGVTDLYAYYRSQSLANYVANKVLFVEKPSPDLGLYEATVDESKGTDIRAFVEQHSLRAGKMLSLA
jgi:hypothetical protein